MYKLKLFCFNNFRHLKCRPLQQCHTNVFYFINEKSFSLILRSIFEMYIKEFIRSGTRYISFICECFMSRFEDRVPRQRREDHAERASCHLAPRGAPPRPRRGREGWWSGHDAPFALPHWPYVRFARRFDRSVITVQDYVLLNNFNRIFE